MPFGGVLMGHVGLLRMPWSVELAFAGSFDYSHPTAHFDGVPHKPFGNPLLSAPPRDETFILVRGGATVLARVRRWWDGPHTRWTLAAGIGASYKYMALEREVDADGGLEDRPYFSHGTPYVSPAVGLDGSALLRSTPTLAILARRRDLRRDRVEQHAQRRRPGPHARRQRKRRARGHARLPDGERPPGVRRAVRGPGLRPVS